MQTKLFSILAKLKLKLIFKLCLGNPVDSLNSPPILFPNDAKI